MRSVLLFLLVLLLKSAYPQEINRLKLDKLFTALEKRNEAMGSIVISKNGNIVYRKAIGYRYISDDIKIHANLETNYRIWSITKMYTATMILQLVDEGKLSLQTTLDHFYPQIPNASMIKIEDMLSHKSGIHDFTQNNSSEDWDAHIDAPLTHDFMVHNIAQYEADFFAGEGFRYSNSNYLLLGYIIERLDGNLYETSLKERISSKIGLLSTYFGVNALDSIENKAFSYQFKQKWKAVDEGDFSGLIPAGAGGIVSTPTDMAKFIEALFAGKLLSESSLNKMVATEDFYGLGIMQTNTLNTQGFGHTGGYIASESSLFYYPKDSLAIAYCTNGIVYRKENILKHVVQIYLDEPFAVSLNRKALGTIILGIGLTSILILLVKFPSYLSTKNLLLLGPAIALLFWAGVLISGFLYGNYSPISDGITLLDSFYSNSGTFMASIEFLIALLSTALAIGLYRRCKALNISVIPVLPIGFLVLSMAGSSLFPSPDQLNSVFINLLLLSMLGPLLSILFWRRKQFIEIRLFSALSLVLMVAAIALILNRPRIPEFVHAYFGLLQRLLYLGLTLWLASVGWYFKTLTKEI